MKTELRTTLKLRRKNMSEDEVITKSAEICKKLIGTKEFQNAEIVMVYLSISNEVDTEYIIKSAISSGKTVLVPVTVGNDIIPCILENMENLKKGAFGIKEPEEKREWTEKIDLCVVPGLGFDKNGGRIGFGRGYYDRFLSDKQCKKVGIAYSNQIEKNVFAEDYDVFMDIVITEEEMIYCG